MACMVLSSLAAWEMNLQKSCVNAPWALPGSNVHTVHFSWELPCSSKQNLATSRWKQPSSDWRNTAIRLSSFLRNCWTTETEGFWFVWVWLRKFLQTETDFLVRKWTQPFLHGSIPLVMCDFISKLVNQSRFPNLVSQATAPSMTQLAVLGWVCLCILLTCSFRRG